MAEAISRRDFLSATAGATALRGTLGRPNIVMILADDMGFFDLGCYGSEIATLNLDRLAEGGLRFTQFYNAARYAPTRAGLLTGRYNHQAGIGHMVQDHGLPACRGRLSARAVTTAGALCPAGYQTFAAGKWRVGSLRGHWPLDRGFDRFYRCPLDSDNDVVMDMLEPHRRGEMTGDL